MENRLIQNDLAIEIINLSPIAFDATKNDWEQIKFSVNSITALDTFTLTDEFVIQRNEDIIKITPCSFEINELSCKIKPRNCVLIR